MKKDFRFAELTKIQVAVMNGMEAEKMFVSEETMKMIEEVFKLWDFTDVEDVRAIRNSVVKYFSDKISKECMNEDETEWLEGTLDKYDEYNCKRSMITAVIDNTMYKMAKNDLI